MVAHESEVLLNNNPRQPNGLLSSGTYSERLISLSSLVGKVAPNLDVTLATRKEDEAHPVHASLATGCS